MIAKTESIVDRVSADIPSKHLTKLDNLHIILRNKCLISALSGFKISDVLKSYKKLNAIFAFWLIF